MGYITKISNLIVHYEAIHFDVKSIMLKVPNWIEYTTGTLATTNEVESRKIGSKLEDDPVNQSDEFKFDDIFAMGSSLTNADIEDFEKLLNNEKAQQGEEGLNFADLPQLLDDLLKERNAMEKAEEDEKENYDEMKEYYDSNFWKMSSCEELEDIDDL